MPSAGRGGAARGHRPREARPDCHPPVGKVGREARGRLGSLGWEDTRPDPKGQAPGGPGRDRRRSTGHPQTESQGPGPAARAGTDTGCGDEDGDREDVPQWKRRMEQRGKGGGAEPTETGTRAVPGWCPQPAAVCPAGEHTALWPQVPVHGPLLTGVVTTQQGVPTRAVPVLPYWGPEGRGCPGWGSARESEHRERVIYRICPAHQYPGQLDSHSLPQTHTLTPRCTHRSTPRDLAHSHEFTPRNTARDSPSAQM